MATSKLWAWLLGVTIPLALLGCSESHIDEKYFLITVNTKVPYWQAAKAGLERGAAQLKVTVNMVGPDSYDAQQQQQEFKRVVGLKPAGILVSPADPALMKADIDSAVAQGIPVITIDADSPESKRLTFIGTNNYQAGLRGGEIAIRQLKSKGNVVFFTMPGQANLDERLAGYKAVFARSPGIKIAEVVDIKGDPTVAFDKTRELVEKSKTRIDGFLCLEAIAGKEVAEVLDRAKATDRLVIAMDDDPGTLDWIRKGGIHATIVQKPATMAFIGLKMLEDLVRHKPASLSANWSQDPFAPVPSFVDTGTLLVDRSNVEDFLKAHAAATGR